jgi:hypothetical protein
MGNETPRGTRMFTFHVLRHPEAYRDKLHREFHAIFVTPGI